MKKLILFSMLCAWATMMNAQNIYYVEPGGTGQGTSWSDAGDLSNALASVSSGDQIWAMKGIYQGFFTIQCQVELYGGFDGTENSLADRQLDWYNPSIITTNHATSSCLSCDHALMDVGYNCTVDGFVIEESGHEWLFGGGLRFYYANVTLRNLVFQENKAQCGGGANLEHCTGRIENVIFRNNKAWDACGGLFLSHCTDMVLVNVLFDNNDASSGNGLFNPDPYGLSFVNRWCGALFAEATVAELINCTFTSTNKADSGSGITCDSSTLHITNTIIDGLELLRLGNPSIDPSYIYFEYCNTFHCTRRPYSWSLQYNHCMHNNPMFDAMYHLQSGSPCIDAGDDNFLTGNVLWDLDLQPRIVGSSVDMGAYESQ